MALQFVRLVITSLISSQFLFLLEPVLCLLVALTQIVYFLFHSLKIYIKLPGGMGTFFQRVHKRKKGHSGRISVSLNNIKNFIHVTK